jgi:tetratricopeptide (TPR) repeat protein
MTKGGRRARRWMAAAMMACAGWLAAAPAQAEWREARAKHFVLYGNMSEDAIRTMATRLEQFDGAIRYLYHKPEVDGQESNPVTVYVLPTVAAVRRLYGKGGDHIAGFYDGRVSGSVAFTPMRGEDEGPNALQPQQVLFHEYAHHFLLGNFQIAYPAWYSEGAAEFVGTARFEREGIMLGVAAQHRAYGLLDAAKLPIETLFDSSRRKLSDMETEQVYGRGWLLTHYLMFDATRVANFNRYLTLLNEGKPSIEAGNEAFGSLKQLDRELGRYLGQSKIPGLLVRFDRLPKVEVSVRVLSPGEQAMIPFRMQSDRGVDRKTAGEVYARASAAAAAYPQDAVAQGWFAEMAYDAGQDQAAEAAVDRALAVKPDLQQALLYKGMLHLRRVAGDKSKDPARWAEARSWIVRANRADPNAAEPLAVFYSSFRLADERPRESAVKGLERAFELVPQDKGLRFMLASQQISAGQIDQAKRTLRPLAYDPHMPPDNPAAALLALLDSGNQDAVKAALAAASAGEKKD